MPLIPEDGSGVPNANTFVTPDVVLAYATDRNKQDAWDAQDVEVQEAAIVAAADFLKNEERFQYRGIRNSYGQRMPWPRTGAQERRGPVIPTNVVPWQLLEAQCELALKALTEELQPDLERGGQIQTKTLDVITTTWFQGAPAETMRTLALGILRPLLRPTAGVDAPLPLVNDAPDAGPYTPDLYTNRNP